MSGSQNQPNEFLLVFTGNRAELEQIQTLFESGELDQLLNTTVLDIGLFHELKTPGPQPRLSLSRWLRRSLLPVDWEAAQTALGTLLASQYALAPAYRNDRQRVLRMVEDQPNISLKIAALEQLLSQTQSEESLLAATERLVLIDPENSVGLGIVTRLLKSRQAATRRCAASCLGRAVTEDSTIVETLVNQMHLEPDRETQWQMAISLGQLAPEHPEAAIAQSKILRLGNHGFELLVAIQSTNRTPEQINILLQVKAEGDELTTLPEGLGLVVLDAQGNKVPKDASATSFLEAIATSDDNYIQLYLYGSTGEEFNVQLYGLDDSAIEAFVI